MKLSAIQPIFYTSPPNRNTGVTNPALAQASQNTVVANYTVTLSPPQKTNTQKAVVIGAAVLSVGALAAYFVVSRGRAAAKTKVLPNSIATPEEVKLIINSFTNSPQAYAPGKNLKTATKDGYDLSGMENGTFRANLHLHTNHSDGVMTVQELLDSVTEYADKIASKVKDKMPPFTVAITDHDTVAGCKEALSIIQKNPEKYKNVKIIFGCELSTYSQIIPQQLKKPFSLHMLLQGLDPFDEKLNKFLNTKQNARKLYLEKLFDKLNKEANQKMFTLKEAENLYPHIKSAYIHRADLVKKYVQAKCVTTPNLTAKLNEICDEFYPKLKLQEAYMDTKETMEFVNSLDKGYMIIAHPGLTGMGEVLKKPEETMAAMNSLFKSFKELGTERALAAEQHYHYYGPVVQDNPNWLKSIESFIEKNNLLKTGGLDSHGKSFYYSEK